MTRGATLAFALAIALAACAPYAAAPPPRSGESAIGARADTPTLDPRAAICSQVDDPLRRELCVRDVLRARR